MAALSLELAEQVKLVNMVAANDLAGLAKESVTRGGTAVMWNTLCSGDLAPRYPNSGTLVHWAIWFQHWDVVTAGVAAGADLGLRGVGSWMDGKSAAEYAAHLDEKARHPYYNHTEEFHKASTLEQGDAAMRFAARVNATAELNLVPFSSTARIDDREVTVKLHDMIEHHCLGGLHLALQRFGARAMTSVLVEPKQEDSPHGNQGTLAHWAVWYQHWEVLRWLRARDCFDTSIRGVGNGWLRGKTASDYADFLDGQCGHSFYGHQVQLQAALTVPIIQAATAAAAAAAAAAPSAPFEESKVVEESNVPSAAPAIERQGAECCKCIDAPATHLISPCRHLCVCGPCGADLQGRVPPLDGARARCPICRAAIESIDEVYMT